VKYVIESVLLIGWSGAFLGAALAGVFVVPVAPAVMMGAVLGCALVLLPIMVWRLP